MIQPVHADQKKLEISGYEGEARRISENRHSGDLSVAGLPKRGDRSVDVRFTYDLNGLLEVEATIVQTGQVVSAIFKRKATDMSEEEQIRAMSRMQQLKADPQKRPRYRDLLSRANLLWQDLDPVPRAHLSREIDRFEAALLGHNPEEMEAAFFDLSQLCQSLDEGERY
jgi:molecular chaperone HscC